MSKTMPEFDDKMLRMKDAWTSFVKVSKYQTRYFFHSLSIEEGKPNNTPSNLLRIIRRLIDIPPLNERLRYPLKSGTQLYRARHYDGTWSINDVAQLGAPPSKLARSGRMNPAGIRYLYLATDEKTALSEVQPRAGSTLVVAEFTLEEDLLLLDFTDLDRRSGDSAKIQSVLSFLGEFAKSITLPINKDGSEHIDYVPSQIVCEFFSQVHLMPIQGEPTTPGNTLDRIHGLRYGSTTCTSGINVVLFPKVAPDEDGFENWVRRTNRPPRFHHFDTWADVGLLHLNSTC